MWESKLEKRWKMKDIISTKHSDLRKNIVFMKKAYRNLTAC